MQMQTLNISLPGELIKKADQTAKREFRNRSELIREALRVYLTEKEEWKELFVFGKQQADKVGVKSEIDVKKLVSAYRHRQ